MGCCLSNKSSAITPDVSLIDMIQSFEQDAVIMDYINKNPKSVLESDDNEKTVLMWAVEKGCDCVVKKGLEIGINIENLDNKGWNAMMYAAKRGNMNVINWLLEYGGELNRTTDDGSKSTALHLAASEKLIEICLVLLKAGANPNAKDASGRVPLDYFEDRRDREKYTDCCSVTYKQGVTPGRLHQEREDKSIDRSLNKAMDIIKKTAVEDIYALGGGEGEESRMEVL